MNRSGSRTFHFRKSTNHVRSAAIHCCRSHLRSTTSHAHSTTHHLIALLLHHPNNHLQPRRSPSGKAVNENRVEGRGLDNDDGVVSNGHHWATARTHEPHPTPLLPTAHLHLRRRLRKRRRRLASPPSPLIHPLPLRHLTIPPSPPPFAVTACRQRRDAHRRTTTTIHDDKGKPPTKPIESHEPESWARTASTTTDGRKDGET
ncbi:hypothetical protein D9613_012131 [Agrocybe pediades]|uniref:Uncharacterized protein n=1 Tax=Agrocybe pediades TaxID=84607 RepID=A0A8H4R3J2_9AGAR|nr:hypothetical protein D9613_012131 [Agrocybe pediades]